MFTYCIQKVSHPFSLPFSHFYPLINSLISLLSSHSQTLAIRIRSKSNLEISLNLPQKPSKKRFIDGIQTKLVQNSPSLSLESSERLMKIRVGEGI